MDHIGIVETPAFILDTGLVSRNAYSFQDSVAGCHCRVLFSMKSLAMREVVALLTAILDGFSASSVFEARMAREFGGNEPVVSHTSPVLCERELAALNDLCNVITVNSLSQLSRFIPFIGNDCEVGIRINPGLSFVGDPRYDPCRRNSKLGVPLDRFQSVLRSELHSFSHVSGIHFHSNCDSEDSGQLLETIHRIESVLGDDLHRFRWLNIGGGYSCPKREQAIRVTNELLRMHERYGLEVVMEPGAAIVRSAGSLIATVEDVLEGAQQRIAILDTTVNHWPEVFEYQFEPDVEGHVDNGPYTYLLAGCSCLAGDLFGVYSFNEPLEVGSRVVFRNAGAYSIAKAHMFNGINLPNIYSLTEEGELVLVKRFTYEDFVSRLGVDTGAIVGT